MILQDARSNYQDDYVKIFKLGRLRWAGHVMRMKESDPGKTFLCTKTEGNRDKRRGRSKLRWCEELEWVVARVGCRNWRINVQSREKWQNLTEEVKTHPEMCTQWTQKNRKKNNNNNNRCSPVTI
jgi:hypothetical protein